MKRLIVVSLAALALLDVRATEWYCAQNENSGSLFFMYNAYYWKIVGTQTRGTTGDPLCADDTYSINSGYYMRVQAKNGSCEFVGKRLTVANGILLQYANDPVTTYFRNQGLILQKGTWYGLGANKSATIEGPIAVESPLTAPFCLASSANGTNAYRFNGKLSSESTCALQFGVGIDTGKAEIGSAGLTVVLAGDCSEYAGSLIVTSRVDSTATTFGTKLQLETALLPGSVVLGRGTVLSVANGTTGATVGAFAVADGASLDLSAGGALTVSTSFVKTGTAALPVEIALSDETFDDWAKTNRYVILTVPVAAGVTEKDFAISGISGSRTHEASQGVKFVDNGDGTKSLVAEFGPLVYQTVGDPANFTYQGAAASSLSDGTHWTSGFLPKPGYHYVGANQDGTSYALNTPGPQASDYVFEGDSLSVHSLFLFNKTFTAPVLRILPSGSINGGDGISTYRVTGGRLITETKATLTAYSGRLMKIESELEGDAEIWVGRKGGTGAPQSRTEFSATNLNFKGTFYISQNLDATYDAKFQTLYVSDERNLGGRLDDFTFNALNVEKLSQVRTRDSFDLTADYNRGILMGDARFYADEGKTIGIRTVLTQKGTIYKEGPGVLDMGGTVRFYNTSTKQPQDAVIAGKNDFVVTDGVLRVSAAYAVDGLNLAFAPATKLVLKLNGSDAELRAKGLVNVKTDTPFALNSALAGKLPFGVEIAEGTTIADGDEYAFVTVSATAADQVEKMLPKSVRTPGGLRADIVRRPEVDGAVTFAGCFEKRGLMLIFR